MEPVHLADLVGREWIFVTVHDATTYCTARMAERVSWGRTVGCLHVSVCDCSLQCDCSLVDIA
jgi:hypothetical protein